MFRILLVLLLMSVGGADHHIFSDGFETSNTSQWSEVNCGGAIMYFVTTENVVNLLSIVASEEVVTFEDTNLQDPLGSNRWRSTGKLPNIVGEFDASKTIDFWGLWYANAVADDWARIRLATSEANLTSSPVVDVNSYICPGSGTGFFGFASLTLGFVDFGDILDQTATDSFTVSTRFNTTTTGIANGLFNKTDAAGDGWRLTIDGANDFDATIRSGADFVTVKTSAASFQDGLWHEARIEVDRTLEVIRIYIDNVLKATSTDTSLVGTLANAEPLRLGATIQASGPWTGDLDEFRFWEIIPSAAQSSAGFVAEIDVLNIPTGLELYWRANEGTGTVATDESGNATNGTITNGTWGNEPPIVSPAKTNLGYVHQTSIISTPASATWFRIDFNFTDNSDGYVQGGSLFLDVMFNPVTGPSGISGPPRLDHSRSGMYSSKLSGGGIDRGGGTSKRDISLNFLNLTEAEALGKLEPMITALGEVTPVGVITIKDEATYPMSYIHYGYLQARNLLARDNDRFTVRVSITEP